MFKTSIMVLYHLLLRVKTHVETRARQTGTRGSAPPPIFPDRPSDQVHEFLQQVAIELFLEGNDQLRQLLRIDPAPVTELLMRSVDVHVRVGAEITHKEPGLPLPAKPPAPDLADQIIRKV